MNNPNGEQEFDPFAEDAQHEKPRRAGAGVAWLALLLALVAAGFSGYQWWLEQREDPQEGDRQALLENLQRNQAGLEQSLQSLQSRLADAEQRNDVGAIAALVSQFDSLQNRVAALGLQVSDGAAASTAMQDSMLGLDQRLATAENSVAALAVRDDAPGKRMDLSEVQHLLQLASERLQLFRDPRTADQALAMADERLASLEDPLYLPVRQRITNARSTLAAIPALDTLQLSGRLGALQAVIPALPFPGESPAEEPAEVDADAGLWERFKKTMSGLVTVRRKAPDADVVLSLEDKDYIRQGLWLQLESARLALMRGDSSAYELSLQRAAATLQASFAQEAGSVDRAATEIDALARVRIDREMPDISAPWAQLRLLREGRETDLGSQRELETDAGAAPAANATDSGPGTPETTESSGAAEMVSGEDGREVETEADTDTGSGDGSG